VSESLDTAASETVAPLPAVDEIPVSVDPVAVVSETLDTAASETVPLLPAIDEMPVSVDPVAVVSVSQEPLPVIVEVQQEIVTPEELPAVLESAAVPSEPAEGAPNPEDVFVLDPGMINEIECALEVDLSVGLDEIAGGEPDEADGDQEVWTIDRRTLEASGEATDGPVAPIPMEQAAPEPENVGVRSNEDASVSRVVSIGTVTTPLSEPIVKNKGRKKQKPVQDEWGFFDPEQCGFPALLAKLDEIARSEKSEA
jgi:hypothetical protein